MALCQQQADQRLQTRDEQRPGLVEPVPIVQSCDLPELHASPEPHPRGRCALGIMGYFARHCAPCVRSTSANRASSTLPPDSTTPMHAPRGRGSASTAANAGGARRLDDDFQVLRRRRPWRRESARRRRQRARELAAIDRERDGARQRGAQAVANVVAPCERAGARPRRATRPCPRNRAARRHTRRRPGQSDLIASAQPATSPPPLHGT